MSIQQSKLKQRVVAGSLVTATIATTGAGAIVPILAHAQDKDTNTATAQSTDTKIANEAELDKAVADAKKAGVQVTEKPANIKTVPYSELGKAKADAEANYKQQIAELQKQAKAQAQVTTNYNALNKKYEDAKNKYAGKTPVSDKTIDGTRVRVYGDYDESKKGGVGYYGKFESIFDTQPGDKTRVLSHSGWLEGAKMTRISGADKKAYTLDDVKKTYPNLKADDMQYYKNLRKGDVLKISEGKGAATDAITGQTYDLYLKVHDAPTSGTQFAGFKRSAENAIVVDFTGSTGVDFDLEFAPKDKPYTPANVIETVESSISYDIDANQAGQTNMMNTGVLNPKNSDVKVFGDKYENISGGGFEDAKSIPGGSIGMLGKAKTFNWKFYANKNERVIKDRVGADQYAARFNLLGDGAKLNAIVKPPKPTALKAEVQKTEIKLQPGTITKPVKTRLDDKGNVTTSKDVKVGDTFSYGLKTTFPTADAKGNPIKELSIVDPYIDAFTYKSSKVHLTDAKGNDVTSDFTIKDDKGSKQHQVSWTPKDPKKYAGKTVYIAPTEFTINSTADLTKYEKDGHLVFPNTVYMTVNGEKVPGNTVEITPKGEETPVKKAFVADTSSWKLHQVGDSKTDAKSDDKTSESAKSDDKATDNKAESSSAKSESKTTDTKSDDKASESAKSDDKTTSGKTTSATSSSTKTESKPAASASTSSSADASKSSSTATKPSTFAATSTTSSSAKTESKPAASTSSEKTASSSATSESTDATAKTASDKTGNTTDNSDVTKDNATDTESGAKTDDKSATDENVNTVKRGQEYGYTLNTTIDAVDKDGKLIKSFGLNDPLKDAIALRGVQVVDKSDHDKDVTDKFSWSGNIKGVLKSDQLNAMRGHKVEMRIGAKIDETKDLKAYKQSDGSYRVENVAEKTQNDKKTPSNKVVVKLDKDQEKPAPKKDVPAKPQAPTKHLATTGLAHNPWIIAGIGAALLAAIGAGWQYAKSKNYFKK